MFFFNLSFILNIQIYLTYILKNKKKIPLHTLKNIIEELNNFLIGENKNEIIDNIDESPDLQNFT